ncbi:MAG: hypothetical protein EKK62_04630, partial [Acidimicrobiia bacterium]
MGRPRYRWRREVGTRPSCRPRQDASGRRAPGRRASGRGDSGHDLLGDQRQVLCVGRDEPEIARRAGAIGREVDELRSN